MNNPFVYDGPVEGKNFIGREWIADRIHEQLLSMKNVILLSPRGWGKASLSREVSYQIWRYHESFRACFVSIRPGMTKKEIGDELILQISMVPGTRTNVDYCRYRDDDEIFNLPEIFAVLNHMKLLVCISGINNILDLHTSSIQLTKLSKIWRMHSNCAYILLGSVTVLWRKSKLKIDPQALKIGRVYFLDKLTHENSQLFIRDRFNQSEKRISADAAQMIAHFSNHVPYYLQLLAWHSWVNADKECTIQEVNTAIEQITGLYRIYFRAITENLKEKQLRFLQSLALEGLLPYSRENIAKYKLNAAGSVASQYKSMLRKEIIINYHGETIFANPFYKHWLTNHYFT